MKPYFFKKWTAAVLSVTLIFSGSFPGHGFASASAILPAAMPLLDRPLIPSDSGRLTAFHSGPGPALFHIQTVHGDAEAQQSILRLLENLDAEGGLDAVFVEGTAFELKPERFRFFPQDMELTMKTADALAQKGLLKGADLFLIKKSSVKGYGIENLETYREDLELLRELLRRRESTQIFTQKLNQQTEDLAERFQSSKLRDFMRAWLDFQRGHLSLPAWRALLHTSVQELLRFDTGDVRLQLVLPALSRLDRLEKLEAAQDAEAWELEKKNFLRIARILLAHRPDLLRRLEVLFVAAEESPADTRELDRFVESLRTALPLNFNFNAFPQILNFFTRTILQSELDSGSLLREMEMLARMLQEELAQTDEDRQLLQLTRQALVFERLFAVEMTPDDYAAVDRALRPSDAAGIAEALGARKHAFENLSEMDRLWQCALDFYRLAGQRDREMTANLERLIRQNGIRRAAVITGGFHAEPMRRYFSGRGYAYALISPQVRVEALAEGREVYHRAVLEEIESRAAKATLETSSPLLFPDEIEAHGFSPDYADALVREALRVQLSVYGRRSESLFDEAFARYSRSEQRSRDEELTQRKKSEFEKLFTGFKNKDIDRIFEKYPAVRNMNMENLHAKFTGILKKTGIEEKVLRRTYTDFPNLFSYSEDNVTAALKQIQQMGTVKKDQMLALRNFLAIHEKIRARIFEQASAARRTFPDYHHVRRLYDRLQTQFLRSRSSFGERRSLTAYVRLVPDSLEREGRVGQMIAGLVRDDAFTRAEKSRRSEMRGENILIEKIEEGASNTTNFIPAVLSYISLFSELLEHGIKSHFYNMGNDSPELQVRRQQLYYTPPGGAASQPIIGHDLLIRKTVLFTQQAGQSAREQDQLVRFEIFPVEVPRDPRLRVADQDSPDYVPFIYDDEYPVYLELALTPEGRSLENMNAVYIGGIRKGEYLKMSVLEKKTGSDNFTPMNVRDLIFRVGTQSSVLNALGQSFLRMNSEDVLRYIDLQDKENILVEAGFVKELPHGRSELRTGEEEYVQGANLRFLMGQSKVRLYPGAFLIKPEDSAYQDDLWNQRTSSETPADDALRHKVRSALEFLAARAKTAGRQDILDRIQRFSDLTTLILKDLPTHYFFSDPDEEIADATRISLQSRAIYFSRRLLESLDPENEMHIALLALYLNRAQYLIDVFHDLYSHGASVNLIYDFMQEQIQEEGFKDWDLIFQDIDEEAVDYFIRQTLVYDDAEEAEQRKSLDQRTAVGLAKAGMLEEHFEQAAATAAPDIQDELLDRAGFQLHARELEKLALEYQSLGQRERAVEIYRHAIQLYHHTQSVDAKNLLPKEVQVELLLFLLRAGMYVEFYDELKRFLLDSGYPEPLFPDDAEALQGGDQTAALWIPDWILGLAPKILYNLRVYAAVVVSPDARRHVLEVQAAAEKLLQDYWTAHAARKAEHDVPRFKTYGKDRGSLEIPVQNNVETVHADWTIEPGPDKVKGALDFYGSDFSRKKRTPFASVPFEVKGEKVFLDLNHIHWAENTRRRYRGIAEHMIALAAFIGRERGAAVLEVRDRKGRYAREISALDLSKTSVTSWRKDLVAGGIFPPQSLRVYRADFHDDMVDLFHARFTMPRHIRSYLEEQGYRYAENAERTHGENLTVMRDLFGTFETQETVLDILRSFGFFDGPVIPDDKGSVSFRLDEEGKTFIEAILKRRLEGQSVELSRDARLVIWRSGDWSPGFWNQLYDPGILAFSEPGADGSIRLPLFMIFEDVKRSALFTLNLSELFLNPAIDDGAAFSVAEEIRAIRERFIEEEYLDVRGLKQIATVDLKFKRLLWDFWDGFAGSWKSLGQLAGRRPLIETLSLEFEALQGQDPLFLPTDHYSMDFQKALYLAVSEGLIDFNGSRIFEIGSGTGVNLLHFSRLGALEAAASDIQSPYVSFTRWNSLFARDAGYLPDSFTVNILHEDGFPEGAEADVILFNTPQIIADSREKKDEIVPRSRGMARTPFVHLFENVRDYLKAHPDAKFMLRLHASRDSGLDSPEELTAKKRYREADVILDFLNSYPDLKWQKIAGTQFFVFQSARHEHRTLYLSRSPGEQIVTGHDASFAFKVLSIQDGLVTVGVRGAAEVRRPAAGSAEPEILKAAGDQAITRVTMRQGDVFEFDTGNDSNTQVIKVALVRAGKERARFGIQAPQEIPVHRQEIYDDIRSEYDGDPGYDDDNFRSELREAAGTFSPLSVAYFRAGFLPFAVTLRNPGFAALWLEKFSGIHAPQLLELPRALVAPGQRYFAGKGFDAWLRENDGPANEEPVYGAAVIDARWTELLKDHPRALYLLLKVLKTDTGSKPLLAFVTDNPNAEEWMRAVRQKGNLDWRERLEFENELLPQFSRLVQLIAAPRAAEEIASFAAEHESAVAGLTAGADLLTAFPGAARFILTPESIHRRDDEAVVFAVFAMMKAAALIRRIPDAARQREILDRILPILFPEAQPGKDGYRLSFEGLVRTLQTLSVVEISA